MDEAPRRKEIKVPAHVETVKMSPEKIDDTIDFVSTSLLHDPRWVFLVPDDSKRLKQIRALVKPTIKWLSANGGHDIWYCRDLATNETLGISVWLPPGIKVEIPFSSLVSVSLKALSTQGLSGTSKIKQYFQGLTEWIDQNSPEDGWVLWYCVIPPTTKFIKSNGIDWIQKIREQLIFVPQKSPSHAGKGQRPIWTYLTDSSLIPTYNALGFIADLKFQTEPYRSVPDCPPTHLLVWTQARGGLRHMAGHGAWPDVLFPLLNFGAVLRLRCVNHAFYAHLTQKYVKLAPRIWVEKNNQAREIISTILDTVGNNFEEYDLRGFEPYLDRYYFKGNPMIQIPNRVKALTIPNKPFKLHDTIKTLKIQAVNGPNSFQMQPEAFALQIPASVTHLEILGPVLPPTTLVDVEKLVIGSGLGLSALRNPLLLGPQVCHLDIEINETGSVFDFQHLVNLRTLSMKNRPGNIAELLLPSKNQFLTTLILTNMELKSLPPSPFLTTFQYHTEGFIRVHTYASLELPPSLTSLSTRLECQLSPKFIEKISNLTNLTSLELFGEGQVDSTTKPFSNYKTLFKILKNLPLQHFGVDLACFINDQDIQNPRNDMPSIVYPWPLLNSFSLQFRHFGVLNFYG